MMEKKLNTYFDFSILTYIKTRANDDTQRKLNYNIILEPIGVDNPLGDNEIKVYLTMVKDGVESVVVEPTTIDNLSDYILKSQEETFSNNKGEVVTNYRLRAWIDESVDTNKLNDKSYSYRFRVNVNNDTVKTNLDKSGANAPVLASNMIPVYYDSNLDLWRKANTNNKSTTITYTVGDINGDGNIDFTDSQKIYYAINNKSFRDNNPAIFNMMDLNKDGKLTNDDMNLITAYMQGEKNDYFIREEETVTIDTSWYSYNDKKWANAVTVSDTNRDTYLNSDVGTVIPMDDINTMWVWIPRYTYTYLNTNTPEEIKIKFENGTNSTGTIKCTDAINQKDSDGNTISETCTDSTNGSLIAGTSTYTHPAFTFGDQELTGIWVGKFEVSSDTTCIANNDDALGSGCNLQTIRPNIKPNEISWRGAQVGTFFNDINKMTETNNKYGFTTSEDTHMMKNIEWGAVTYLSHSKYGINKKMSLNSANTYTTGCGPQSEGSTSASSTCNSYQTTLGQSASTTGNVYGVYDMSGGSFEFIMGDQVWTNGQMMSGYQTANNYNSAFTGILYDGNKETSFTGIYAFPESKHYDKYSYGEDYTEYTRGKLGDATKEMEPTNYYTWYSEYAYFLAGAGSWFVRSGTYASGSGSGLFYFTYGNGGADFSSSTRAVLSIK